MKIKFIIALVAVLCATKAFSQVISIEEAREKSSGTVVTVQGIVLNGDETSDLRFLQDETAGLAIFDGTSSVSVQAFEAGDKIEIEGEIGYYNGLFEIKKVNAVSFISTANPLPEPKPIKVSELGEKYQSERVIVECVSLNTSEETFAAKAYGIIAANGSFTKALQIPQKSTAVGKDIPTETLDIIGISYTANLDYLLLANYDELIESNCLQFSQFSNPFNINETSVDFSWSTKGLSDHEIFLGTTIDNLVSIENVESVENIDYTFDDLSPATVYYMKVIANNGGQTVESKIIPFVTKSESTGTIDVYFNNDVDASFSDGSSPTGTTNQEFESRLLDLIEEATETIDIAMYNINKTIIVNYLIDAHNKGVVVRYIADDETSNFALDGNPPFEVLYGNSGSDLMHNKFLIIDREKKDESYVLMGSTNFTTNQMLKDPNHMLVIQDQSLARVYTIEFEEMWGGDLPIPNFFTSKFGDQKEDNTPHFLNIAGRNVESYFSPSDRLTSKIENQISTAEKSMDIGLLTMTKNELGQAIVDQYENGISTKVIIENFDDIGSEYNYLNSNGVPVTTHPKSTIFHHKYGIFDEGGENPRVLTGSHNWTNKAEFSNDENTLIIYDQSITNIFKQEFRARWGELVNTYSEEILEARVYPNPVESTLFLDLDSQEANFEVFVYNVLGEVVLYKQNTNKIGVSSLVPGQYFIKVIQGNQQFNAHILKF